jgi:hypothetical protein
MGQTICLSCSFIDMYERLALCKKVLIDIPDDIYKPIHRLTKRLLFIDSIRRMNRILDYIIFEQSYMIRYDRFIIKNPDTFFGYMIRYQCSSYAYLNRSSEGSCKIDMIYRDHNMILEYNPYIAIITNVKIY